MVLERGEDQVLCKRSACPIVHQIDQEEDMVSENVEFQIIAVNVEMPLTKSIPDQRCREVAGYPLAP